MTAAIKLPVSQEWTAAAYLETEHEAVERHEFHYGKLIKMAGESKNANKITNNILVEWQKGLRKKGFEIFTHEVKLEVEKNAIYRYPDLMIASKEDTSDTYLAKKPVLIIEVASKQSFYNDSIVKRKEYYNIETLDYYLIISQLEVSVILHIKENSKWQTYFFDDKNDHIKLPNLDIEIALSDMYEGIEFEEEAPPSV